MQELLAAAGVREGGSWEEFAAAHGGDERFTGLASEGERLAAFEAYTLRLRATREAEERKAVAAAEAAARVAARAAERAAEEAAAAELAAVRRRAEEAAAAEAEAAYRALMLEHEAAIASGAGYAQVKLMMWADPRWAPPGAAGCWAGWGVVGPGLGVAARAAPALHRRLAVAPPATHPPCPPTAPPRLLCLPGTTRCPRRGGASCTTSTTPS